MYTDSDFQNTKKRMWERICLLTLLALALSAGVLVLNRLRIQWAVMVGLGLAFVLCYFLWSFKVQPWYKYYKFLREMRTGQRRSTECEFVSSADETQMRDGVEVRQFITKVGEEEEDERLFYWDADKPMPSFTPGDKLHIVSYGNYIVQCEQPSSN